MEILSHRSSSLHPSAPEEQPASSPNGGSDAAIEKVLGSAVGAHPVEEADDDIAFIHRLEERMREMDRGGRQQQHLGSVEQRKSAEDHAPSDLHEEVSSRPRRQEAAHNDARIDLVEQASASCENEK